MKSIKAQIIDRLLAVCHPLIAARKLRSVERKRTLFLLEPRPPSLHLVITDEHVVGEDHRGYTIEVGAMFKLHVADGRNAYEVSDEVTAFLQEAIEADSQLTHLANYIKYEGDTPFTSEELKPDGGTVLSYTIAYRRVRAQPSVTY